MATPLSVLKKAKMILLPEKEWSYRPETLACRHDLTLQIALGGSHLTTSLPVRVVRLKMSKMELLFQKFSAYIFKAENFVTTAHQRCVKKEKPLCRAGFSLAYIKLVRLFVGCDSMPQGLVKTEPNLVWIFRGLA